jgi:hypothetical protein
MLSATVPRRAPVPQHESDLGTQTGQLKLRMSTPSMQDAAGVGISKRAIMLNTVDLLPPVGSDDPTISPGGRRR